MEQYWDDQKAFSLDNGKYYFAIQTCDDGYDYTIYHSDFSDYDGGQLDEPDMSIDEATESILEDFGMQNLSREPYDYDELTERGDEVQQERIAQARATLKPSLDQQIHAAEGKKGTAMESQGMSFNTPER